MRECNADPAGALGCRRGVRSYHPPDPLLLVDPVTWRRHWQFATSTSPPAACQKESLSAVGVVVRRPRLGSLDRLVSYDPYHITQCFHFEGLLEHSDGLAVVERRTIDHT